MLAWLDTLVQFPSDYDFLKYLVISVIIVVVLSLSYGLIISTFSAIFSRR